MTKTNEKHEDIEKTSCAATVDELLCDTEEAIKPVQYAGPKDKPVYLLGIVKHSDLVKHNERTAIRIKNRIPATADIPDQTIEAASWIEACMYEPKVNFDQALKLCERYGGWVYTAMLKCQELSGVRLKELAEMAKDFDKDPFAETTTKPA
jgi:hypothetical protein